MLSLHSISGEPISAVPDYAPRRVFEVLCKPRGVNVEKLSISATPISTGMVNHASLSRVVNFRFAVVRRLLYRGSCPLVARDMALAIAQVTSTSRLGLQATVQRVLPSAAALGRSVQAVKADNGKLSAQYNSLPTVQPIVRRLTATVRAHRCG